MLSIKKAFKGTTSETFSFGSAMKKINITNDGTDSLTATINSKSIIVPGGSSRELEFSSFMQAEITATGAFRGYVMNDLATGTEGRQPSLVLADTTAPNAVTGLAAGTATANSMPLTWTLSNSGDVTKQEVAYSTDGTNFTVANANVASSATSYTVTGLTASTSYTFRVVAIDAAGNRSTAVTVVKSTIAAADTTAPNPVTGLAAGTATANSMPLTWTLSSSGDVANQEVAYSTDGTTFTVASAVVNASSTSYTVTGLTASTSYTFRVVAIDAAGNRSTAVTVVKSTIASADTTPPAQVQGLTVTDVTHDSMTVSWSHPDPTDVASYDVVIEEVGFDYNNLVAYPDDSTVTFDQTVNNLSDWVHPSTLWFENGWNNHKYWMGINPYPDTQSSYEDPFVFYSDDGDNWFTPAGLTQPIFQESTTAGATIQHNSDSHLFMDYDGVTMHYLNRGAYAAPNDGSIIECVSSTDGVTWSNRQIIINDFNNGRNLVSPSVCLVNGKYYMFATDADDQTNLVVLEATEVRGTWTEINRISTGTLGAVWHPEVRYINQEFIVIASTGAQQGGNLMLGKFTNVLDTTMVGRNNAFITPPATQSWNQLVYKSSLVVKTNGDIEVFVGFKGAALNSSTDWRVTRVQAQRLTQTLDLTGETYQEVATYADMSSFTTPMKTIAADYNRYAVEFTVAALVDGATNAKFIAFSSGTTQHFNLGITNGVLRAEIWKSGVHSFKNISYGLSLNDRVLMSMDNDINVYINGRLVHTVPDAISILTDYGARFGDYAIASMSNIKVYKKEAYIFSETKALDYKTELLNEYAITPSNFALVDEFNRASLGTTSDNGVTYEIVGSPTIATNALKPNGNANAVFVPTSANYSLIYNLPTPSNAWQVYLRYTDANNHIKLRNYQYTPFQWEIVEKVGGTETITQYKAGVSATDKKNLRVDVINNTIKLYADGVYLRDIPLPSTVTTNKVGFTSHSLTTTTFDYAIIKKLA